MARTIQISVPSQRSDELIGELRKLNGLVGMRVQRGVSLQPQGDVISIDCTNRSLHPLMRQLDGAGVLRDESSSVVVSAPVGMVAAQLSREISEDSSEATWEEIELAISRESGMTANGVGIMVISGMVAALGISTGALHLIVGAMLVAPGFEPLSRIALGVVGQSRAWRRGLGDALKGYVALVAAAAITALVMRALGTSPFAGESYLRAGEFTSYWTTLSAPSLLVSAAASIAGALLLAARRSILTSGVMVMLALVPSATLFGMALATGRLPMAGMALARWVIDVILVIVLSGAVLAWKRRSVHRRRMAL